MDVISHGLWGALALGRTSRKMYMHAFLFSILPDLLSEGVLYSLSFLKLPGMPDWAQGHPNITDFPVYARYFYNLTHSLIIFSVVFIAVWLIRKKPWRLLAVWGIHIVIDIPTHGLSLFPTPFLWPLSGLRIDGINWGKPLVLIPNLVLLAGLYTFWLIKYKQGKKRSG